MSYNLIAPDSFCLEKVPGRCPDDDLKEKHMCMIKPRRHDGVHRCDCGYEW